MKTPKDSLVWEDIVFENKHKAYGAYVLRKSYSSYVLKAALITTGCLVLAISFPKILGAFESEKGEERKVMQASVEFIELAPPPPIEKMMAPPPKAPEVQKVVKYVPPKVTKEEVVEEELPTIEEIKTNLIGTADVEGKEGLPIKNPVVVVEEGTGSASDEVFDIVEESPEYTGGMEALAKFLQKQLRYPAKASRMGIEGTVYVGFIVDQKGAITEVKVMKGIDDSCDAEAVRVISKMPNWKPGKQRGQAVKVRYVMPIKFKLN